jgi:hypothetical protein
MTDESPEVRADKKQQTALRNFTPNKETNQAGTSHSAVERASSYQQTGGRRSLTASDRGKLVRTLRSRSVRDCNEDSKRKGFTPIGVLKDVFCVETVRRLLGTYLRPEDVAGVADYVCPPEELEPGELGGRRILAALLDTNNEGRILRFKERGITDKCVRTRNDHFTELWREQDPTNDGQEENGLKAFCESYWQFMSPFLKKLPGPIIRQAGAEVLTLDEYPGSVTLPWTHKKQLYEYPTFSTVWEVRIHPDHHNLVSPTIQKWKQ